MDPNIMKLLEEDEDETMHSGADVEAFQAVLNRDIGGDASSTSQLSDSASLPHESNQASIQMLLNWQTSGAGSSQQDVNVGQQQHVAQHSSAVELKQQSSASNNQPQQNDMPQEHDHFSLHQNQSHDDKQIGQPEQLALQSSNVAGVQISDKYPAMLSEPDKMKIQGSDSQFSKLHAMANPSTASSGKQIQFVQMLRTLKPHLDKDREMQLLTLFHKLKKNEIARDQFLRHMRNIVGEQVLKMAVSQLQSQSQAAASQHSVRPPLSAGSVQFGNPSHFTLIRKDSTSASDPSLNTVSSVQVQTDLSSPAENSAKKLRMVDYKPDSQGIQARQMAVSTTNIVNQERDHSTSSIQGQNMHVQQASFPLYGSSDGNFHPHTKTNIGTSGSYIKQQPHDLQMKQMPQKRSLTGSQLGVPNQAMGMQKIDQQISSSDSNRDHPGSVPNFTNKQVPQQTYSWQPPTSKEQSSAPYSSMDYVKQEPGEQTRNQQLNSRFSNSHALPGPPIEQGKAASVNLADETEPKQLTEVNFQPPVVPPRSITATLAQMEQNNQLVPRSITSPATITTRTPPKKPAVGQKKQAEALGPSTATPSKKRKASGAFSDQSIDHLNDVTAVSGVNLREEEEQLFSGSKEESRASEASRRVVQEEEERLILQKNLLQKKLAEIMAKNGLRNISSDVERCISMCVEERMCRLISNIIRVSKQQVDAERPRHRTVLTSDVQKQITAMNQKVKEEWEKKQAEAEKLRKANEPEDDNMIDKEKDKDDGCGKAAKAHKEEDDKMRANAANIAARAAVGFDDMLSKWQLMAEQARQKREGEATGPQPGAIDGSRKPALSSGRTTKDNLDAEKRSHTSATASGTGRKFGRNQVVVPPYQIEVVRSLSVKDVMSVLERESQTSKSTLIYRLYERIQPLMHLNNS